MRQAIGIIFLAIIAIVFFNLSKQDTSHKKGEKIEFNNGLALVSRNDGTQVFVDSAGNKKLGPYRAAFPFCNGKALVLAGGRFFFFDTLGNKLDKDYSIVISSEDDHSAIIMYFSGKTGEIKKSQTIIR